MAESRKERLERGRAIFNEDFIESFSNSLTKIIDPGSGECFSKAEAKSLIISLVGAVVDDVSDDGLAAIIEQKMSEFGVVDDSEEESETVVRVATTPQFYALAQDSIGRNRGPNDELLKTLDLEGVHVLALQMLHNDHEWRGRWLCKLAGSEEAVHVWMDNGPEAYETYTSLRKVSDG